MRRAILAHNGNSALLEKSFINQDCNNQTGLGTAWLSNPLFQLDRQIETFAITEDIEGERLTDEIVLPDVAEELFLGHFQRLVIDAEDDIVFAEPHLLGGGMDRRILAKSKAFF